MVIEDGILILNKDEHPLKAFLPIEFTDDGITTFFKFLHSLKALFPIESTEEGIVICVNDKHALKAYFPIDLMNVGIVISSMVDFTKIILSKSLLFVLNARNLFSKHSIRFSSHGKIVILSNFGQQAKGLPSIDCIDDGIVTFSNDKHPLKTFFPIEVTEEGIMICVNEHPQKAFFFN